MPPVCRPQLREHRFECRHHVFPRHKVVRKGGLGTERLARLIGLHRPIVLGPCQMVEIIPRLAELGRQELSRLASEVEPRSDAEIVHLCRRHRSDTMEFAYRQLGYEVWSHFRGDDEQPVRLAVVRRELCQELVVGHPRRGGQARLLADGRPDFLRNRRRRTSIHHRRCHIEIGLVERQRLNERRIACEDGADLLRHRSVDIKTRRHEHKLGTLAPGRDRGHCRVHTKFARLVTRGSHHAARSAATDGDRKPAQCRIVALLHRRIERVHVDMDDATETGRRVGKERHAAVDDTTKRDGARTKQGRSTLPRCR